MPVGVRTHNVHSDFPRGIASKNGAVLHQNNRGPIPRRRNGCTDPRHAATDDD